MTLLTQTIEKAMLDRAPAMHQQLKAAGKLTPYLRETAGEINRQVVTSVQEARLAQGWDKLPPLELTGQLNSAQNEAMHVALDAALQFPPDETSSPSPG